MWPKDSIDEFKAIEEEHHAYQVCDQLRKEVLVPIRKTLELPEVYMNAETGRLHECWKNGTNSTQEGCLHRDENYTKLFKKHNEARFSEYLSRVKERKEEIAANALLSHEILASAYDKEASNVVELQWNGMVQDLLEKGKLKNCIAVCGVSRSMYRSPMDVCVTLGLLVS